MRRFDVTAVCVPGKHYMADLRLPQGCAKAAPGRMGGARQEADIRRGYVNAPAKAIIRIRGEFAIFLRNGHDMSICTSFHL